MPRFDRKQRELNRLIREIKSRRFPYRPREGREIDWSKYDQAQLREINDMLLTIRDAVDEAALRLGLEEWHPEGPGRPPYPPADMAKALLIQQYFGVSNRVAAGLVLLFREKMAIREAPSYKAIERAYEYPEVLAILEEVLRLTQEPLKSVEHNFAADGTGLPTSVKHNWERDRDDEQERASFQKLVAMVGTTYSLVSAVEFPENPYAHDSPFLEPLLHRTSAVYPSIGVVSLDEAFLSRENCELINAVGGIPRISLKQGITLKQKGSPAWRQMLLSFLTRPQEWLREYHMRSVVESVFSAFKRKFQRPLMRRISKRRRTEALARICTYNLRRLCYLRYLEGLDVGWGAS